MATQQVYFINPDTVTDMANKVTDIQLGRPYGFKEGLITSVQSSIPDYEWAARVQLAKAARSIIAFGAHEGVQSTDCQANHVSCRVPTGWLNPSNTGAGFKYTINSSAFDTAGYPAASTGGALSGVGGTSDLRDLDPANVNPYVFIMPAGCFLDEVTASSLLKVKIADNSIIWVTGAQDYMRTNGYSFAGGAKSIHFPLYMNEPRCNAVCHLHGFAEAMSCLSKGVYPVAELQQALFAQCDYYEYPSFTVSEAGLGLAVNTFGKQVATNYRLFLNDMTGQGLAPLYTTSIATNSTAGYPGNTTRNWETKFLYLFRNHGLTAWCYTPDRVGEFALFLQTHSQSFSQNIGNMNDQGFYINQSPMTVNGVTLPRFISPEAKTYINSTGATALFRQQNLLATGALWYNNAGATGAPGAIQYDGPIHSFLNGNQLDAWYSGQTGAVGQASYDISLWGVADDATKDAYNWLKANGSNLFDTSGATIYPRYFSDTWSNPMVRYWTQNIYNIANTAFMNKGIGSDYITFQLPGYDM